MKNLIKLVVFIMVIIGCTKDDDPIVIRLENESSFSFENVIINTSTGDKNFGSLDAGSKTEYKEFSKAYSYAYVEVEVDGKTYKLIPTDYVGEDPLASGQYTYILNLITLSTTTYELTLKFRED